MFDSTASHGDGTHPIWSSIGDMMGSLERGLWDRLAAAKFHAADPNSQRTDWERRRAAGELVHATADYAQVGNPEDVPADKVHAWTVNGWAYLDVDDVEWDGSWPSVGGEDIGGRWVAKGTPDPDG